MIDISIIIVNYNVKDYLEQLLYSIFNASKNLKTEIFIVDNHSTDGSCEFLEANFKDQITLIKNKKNVGFGKANNQAMRIAKGKYFLIINPDTIIQENSLEILKGFMEKHPEAGAAGCKVLNPDGTLQLACRRGYPTPLNSFFKIVGLSKIFPKSETFSKYNLTFFDENTEHEVDALSGSFMFIRKEVLDQVGLFDENFFMYGEDLDLCFRINKKAKIYYTPETEIVHFKGESSKSNYFKTKYEFYRSMSIFVKKSFHSSWLQWSKPFLLLAIFLNGIISIGLSVLKKYGLQIFDILMVCFSFFITLSYRFGIDIPLPPFFDFRSYFVILGIYSFVYLSVFYLLNIYNKKNRFFLPRVTAASFLAGGLTVVLLYLLRVVAFSRFVIYSTWSLALVLHLGWRFVYSRFSPINTGYMSKKRVLFIGTSEKTPLMIKRLLSAGYWEYDLVGLISEKSVEIGKKISGYQILGDLKNLAQTVRDYSIHEVVSAKDFISYENFLKVINRLKKTGTSFYFLPEVEKNTDYQTEIYNMINQQEESYLFNLHLGIKRLFDICLSMILLFIGFPFFVIWALFRKFHIDKQVISLYNDEKLTLYKMDCKGVLSYYLYLIRVLSGDLSFIGISFHDTGKINFIGVKPGLISIVGLFQRKMDFDQKLSLYSYYYKNFNFLFDFEIGLRFFFRKKY